MPSLVMNVKPSQVDLPKVKGYVDVDPGASTYTSTHMSLDGWDGIVLEYSVDWPLQLFFTQDVLSK